jgi:hypothetical protein
MYRPGRGNADPGAEGGQNSGDRGQETGDRKKETEDGRRKAMIFYGSLQEVLVVLFFLCYKVLFYSRKRLPSRGDAAFIFLYT